MFRLFSTPEWFNGLDIVFDSVGLIVALLIAAYSFRVYRLNHENKYVYFSLAFIAVAFSFAIKTLTSSVLYFTPVRDAAAAVLGPVTGPSLTFSFLFYRGAFFLQMFAMLGALLLIFFISQKSRARLHKYYEFSQIALFVYLVLLISIVSNFSYFVFYLTSAVLLGLIVLNYYKNYLNTNHNKNSFRVMLSFLVMFFGNIFFIFVFLYSGFYVIGELLTLIGFLLLLSIYMRVKA